MRMRSVSRSVKQTSKRCFAEECPMMISRDSFTECSSSGKIRATGLLNTETASAKLMLCFLKFDRALRGSHPNTNDIVPLYRITKPRRQGGVPPLRNRRLLEQIRAQAFRFCREARCHWCSDGTHAKP